MSERAERVGDGAGERVVGEGESLELGEAGERVGDGAGEVVVGEVEILEEWEGPGDGGEGGGVAGGVEGEFGDAGGGVVGNDVAAEAAGEFVGEEIVAGVDGEVPGINAGGCGDRAWGDCTLQLLQDLYVLPVGGGASLHGEEMEEDKDCEERERRWSCHFWFRFCDWS